MRWCDAGLAGVHGDWDDRSMDQMGERPESRGNELLAPIDALAVAGRQRLRPRDNGRPRQVRVFEYDDTVHVSESRVLCVRRDNVG